MASKELTIEQLVKINKPVWIVNLVPTMEVLQKGWCIVEGPTPTAFFKGKPSEWCICCHYIGTADVTFPLYENYGITWLCYNEQPTTAELRRM